MALPSNGGSLPDWLRRAFKDAQTVGNEDETAIRVCVDNPDDISGGGGSTPGDGKITITSLNDSSWTSITALTNRVNIALQNQSDNDNKIIYNYDNTAVEGWRIEDGGYVSFSLGEKSKIEKLVQMAWTFVNDR